MGPRHQLQSFKKEVTPLLELITNDVYLESIWLSTMSLLEDIAAQYILSNITEATPKETIPGILDHAKDEERHAKVLSELRAVHSYPNEKYYALEREWKKIAEEFIMGFFNSPELREANHRHAAYVHGAQTIERFPFRIYTLYLSLTKNEKVKELLPAVIADESEHVEFGKRMYNELSPEERMPLTRLYRLEEDLCLMMLKRMNLSLREAWGFYTPALETALEVRIAKDNQFEIAWNYALSCGEKHFSLSRAERLKEANTLLRSAFRSKENHRDLEKTLVTLLNTYIYNALSAGLSAEVIQNRFNHHYTRMIYHTNSIPLHYAYFRILEESELDVSLDEVKRESKLWSELLLEIAKMDQYEDSLSFSRA